MEDIKHVHPPFTWMWGNGLEVTYTYNHTMTLLENVYALYKQVQLITKSQNEVVNAMKEFVSWATDYINVEVGNQLQQWLNDGTLEEIINTTLFKEKANVSDVDSRGLNVVENGVDNTGLSDVSIALQQLINDYKHIYLPNGIYKLDSTLVLADDVMMVGESKDGVLLLNDTDPVNPSVVGSSTIHVVGVNVVIKNLSIKGKQLIDESTQQYTIGTGHNILIDNLNTPKQYNTIIENVKVEDGYNGLTFQRGCRGLYVKNIETINHHHGIQIYQASDVVIENHTHITTKWCKRGVTIHSGAKNVVYKNGSINGTDLCGIYLRFESESNIMNIENITIDTLDIVGGSGTRQNTFAGILVENNGVDKKIHNIKIIGVYFENLANGIMLRNSDLSQPLEKFMISGLSSNNITSMIQWGGTAGLESNKYNLKFVIKDIVTDSQIRARLAQSIVSNVVCSSLGVDKSVERNNKIVGNVESDVAGVDAVTITNGLKTGSNVLKLVDVLSGTTDGTGLITLSYPAGLTRNDLYVVSVVLYNTNNIPFIPTSPTVSYGSSSLNIQLSGESTFNRPFKVVVMGI